MLLQRCGEFKESGFECVNCKRDKELYAWRGHGCKPRSPSGVILWEPEEAINRERRWAEESDLGTDPINGEWGAGEWMFANYGHVYEKIGQFWDCCPKWYGRYYEGVMMSRAHWIVDLVFGIEDNFKEPLLPAEGVPLWLEEWTRIARIWLKQIQHEQQERQVEKIRSKHK